MFIKIEAPGVGDYLRDFLGQITPHHSPAHVNRNKRSVTLERSEAGRRLSFRILETADIFVDGFAGDATSRLGVGYEDKREVKPDIIYAQCSGCGSRGPYAPVPTHGMMMGSLGGGVPLEMGQDGLVHEQVGGFGDGTVVGATYTALTAVAALHRRATTAKGCYIDGTGSDAILATQWFGPTYAWNDERLTDRRSLARGEGTNAKYHFYETADGKFLLFRSRTRRGGCCRGRPCRAQCARIHERSREPQDWSGSRMLASDQSPSARTLAAGPLSDTVMPEHVLHHRCR
jgi:formyl-CoA transferase